MSPQLATGLALVGRNRAFGLLWVSRATSFVGSSLGLVALLLYLSTAGAGVAAVTLLMLCGDLAPALLAPMLGAVADRVELRRLMLACEIGQAMLTAVIAVWLPVVPLLLTLVTIRAVLAQIFQPASRTAIPALVSDAQLPAANAALGFGEHGMSVLGPVLAAALVSVLGVRGLLLVDAATFLGSAALLVGLPRLATDDLDELEEERSFLRHAGAGLAYLCRSRQLRIVVVSFAVVVIFNAVDDVALVFLARGPLGSGPAGASLLYAGSAAGLLVGYAAVSRSGTRLAAPVLLVAGYAVSSLGNLLTGLAWAVVVALAVQTVRGLGLAAQDVAAATLIQRAVPRALQGRTFGNFYGAIGLAAGVSYLLGGVLVQTSGARLTFIVAGTGGMLTAAITAISLHSRRRS